MIGYTHWIGHTRLFHIIIFAIAHWMHIYIIASLFLFCIMTFISASIFNLIYKSAKEFNDDKAELISASQMEDKLSIWKRWYQSSCRTVADVDYCFGWTLLLSFCFIFVEFIILTFWIFNSLINNSSIDSWSKCLVDSSFLSYIAVLLVFNSFPVDYLHSQVFFKINFHLFDISLFKNVATFRLVWKVAERACQTKSTPSAMHR